MDEVQKNPSDGSPASDDVAVPGMDVVARLVQAISSYRFEDADAAFRELVSIGEKHADVPPRPAYELADTATHCELAGDWEGARAAYLQILELTDTIPFDVHRARICLCRLLRLQNRFQEALVHAVAALDGACTADSAMLFSAAATAAVPCYLHEKMWSDARAVIDRALAKFDSDPVFNGPRASMLTMRANCALGEHDLGAAGQDLAVANATLGPMMDWSDPLQGIQADLIFWWTTTAKLRGASGDADGALTAWSEAIARSQRNRAWGDDVYSRNSLAGALEQFADALEEYGRNGDAYDARAESKAILEEIGLADFQS